MTKLLDGKAIAAQLELELTQKIANLKSSSNIIPGLAAVLIGDNPASQVYVRRKSEACQRVGIYSRVIQRPPDISQQDALSIIRELNEDPQIHGILLQLPLPSQLNESDLLRAILPHKDVDGFHPENMGKLALGEDGGFAPCTPRGVIEILRCSNINTSGKHAVIVGRSNIVGKPLALLLMQKREGGNATVTVCHSQTPRLGELTKQADILIAAIGRPLFIRADMVKSGAVVVDVGINRINNPNTKSGYSLVGDVDFENVKNIAEAITPVPGGVGPMTIAMLLQNTYESAARTIR